MEGLEILLSHLDNWDNYKAITVRDLQTMLKDVIKEKNFLDDMKAKHEEEILNNLNPNG